MDLGIGREQGIELLRKEPKMAALEQIIDI